jgi:hypothetical protein
MVPPVKYFLVGSALYKKEPNDYDICGVLSKRDFELTFGYTHETLMKAYKEKPYSDKLKRYLFANKITGWGLAPLFGKKVDFKWICPTMLYKPNIEIKLEADVIMCL